MADRIRISRRSLLLASGGALLGTALPAWGEEAGSGLLDRRLVAARGKVPVVGASQTAVWCYDGRVPGPELRLRQGGRVRIVAENQLAEDTTVHWHGLRVPNAMDGAPYVTQPPIASGATFTYEFAVPDAGTYWYHPHAHSSEQIGRGLMGAFIVEETTPLSVDRDVTWVLADWRLDQDASVVGGFDNPMEMSMSGRIGNTVTINGRVRDRFPVRSGERIRLRLINAAAARIFGLEFRGLRPLVITFDGQPVEPHAPDDGRIVLGPAMRTDLILDATGKPGSLSPVVDTFYDKLSYKLVDVAYSQHAPLRERPLDPPQKLPPNTMPEPDIAHAERHVVTLTGGMMGSMGGDMQGMMGGGGGMMGGGSMWAINGVAVMHDDMRNMKPVLRLARGKSYVLAIDNRTAWYHPIHLHGHSFRVIARNGRPTKYQEWRDTVLMPPRERADIALVADNPGDWMFHCHILDHQEGGMMSVIRVT